MRIAENVVVAGRFRLDRMIGRGGMGSVWQARHLGLDTDCAIKFIEGELANLGEAHARFEREAKAAAQLRSQHVVQIFDHGVWENIPFIAMELLNGQDLGKTLAEYEGGRMDPARVHKIMVEVSRALTKAHTLGIVHRDLKPDNIFIVDEDGLKIAKVLDFGIAKLSGNNFEGSTTKTGAMLGTPFYMSPEQAQGVKTVDSRSDLWSLAVIVFQCITGRLPFESDALGDLLVKIIVNPIPVPSHLWPGVPPGFDAWFAKAGNRDPAQRYQTAKEFTEALMMALGQSNVTDVMDKGQMRAAMLRAQNQTAFLAHVPAAPTPASALARSAAAPQNTPNPAVRPAMGSAPQFGAITPNPAGMGFGTPNPAGQGMMAPPVGTFSGTQAPVVPKSGPNVGVIVGIAAVVALLAIGGGALALRSKTSATPAPSSIASVAPPHETAVPAAPPASVSVAESAPSSAPSAAPSVTVALAPETPGAGHVTQQPGQGRAKPAGNNGNTASNTKPTQPTQPTTPTTPAQPVPKPSATGWNAGF